MIPMYYFISIVGYLAVSFIQSLKYFFLSTTNFYQTEHFYDYFLYILLESTTFMGISFIHYIIYKISEKLYIPTIISDLLIISLIVIIVILAILDGENSREMQTDVSWDHLIAYNNMKHPFENLFTKRQFVEQGETGFGRGTSKTINDAIVKSPGHWTLLISVLVLGAIIVLIILLHSIKIILLEFLPNKKPKIYQWNQIIALKNNQLQIQNIKYGNITLVKPTMISQQSIAIIQFICLILTIVLISLFCRLMPGNTMSSYVPFYYKTIKSFKTKMHYDNKYIQNALSDYLNEMYQFGQVSIHKDYPLVHGTEQNWCSFNQILCEQKYKFKSPISLSNKQTNLYNNETQNNFQKPNIIQIFYESFSPSPNYLAQQMYYENQNQDWINQQPYDPEVMPELSKIASNSINFLGMSTNSLPTVQAWPTLITTEKVSLTKLNMISSVNRSFESHIEQLKISGNYHTTYFSPAPAEFDGKYMWYRNKNIFDQIHYYAPTEKQAKDLNVPLMKSSWIDDMVLFREMMLGLAINEILSNQTSIQNAAKIYCKYTQQQNLSICQDILQRKIIETQLNNDNKLPNKNQPLYISALSISTHFPFKGIYSNDLGLYNMSIKNNYERMLQYSQKQISQFINFALELNQNTIYIIHGDHGSRQLILSKNLIQQTQKEYINIWQKQCNKGTSGNDQMFDVSAIFGFGSQVQKIQKNVKKYIGKTYIRAFDYDDLINLLLTQIDINTPTSRISFITKQNIESNTYLDTTKFKLSVSATHNIIEARQNNSIIRSNMFGSSRSNLIENTFYPTCIDKIRINEKNKLNETVQEITDKKYKFYEKARKQLRLFNYYQEQNHLFNKAFYNENCSFDPILLKGQFCQLQ